MNKLPTIFDFEGREIRIVMLDDAPHFVAKDVAERLGYSNTADAISKHCRGVAKRYPITDALGRSQEARVLSEPDVLRLIVRSKLPEAERFERWVFETVLPAIRKDGLYVSGEEKVATGEMSLEEMTLRVMQGLQAKLDRAQGIVEEHIELLTVNEFFALTHRYARHSERVRVGGAAARLAKLRGITLSKSARTFTDRLGNVIHTEVNVYPRAILEEVDGTALLVA